MLILELILSAGESKTKNSFQKLSRYAYLEMRIKKVMLRSGAILCGVAGLLLIPDMLYSARGIAEIQDCADGSKWMMTLHIVITLCLLFLAFWLFARASAPPR